MIEVLIAIVVVAVGMLGIAGLQAALSRFNSNSYNRGVAVALAMDMSERLRAYNADGQVGSTYPHGTPTLTAACFSTTGCSRQQMAGSEYAAWQQEIATQLPSGSGVICIDSDVTDEDAATPANPMCDNHGHEWAIKVWWNEDRDGSGTLKHFTMVY